MKTTKKLALLSAGTITLLLSNCAPVPGPGTADLNGDGVVSSAEHNAHYKRANQQQVTPTKAIRTTRDTLWNARSIRNSVKYW